MHVLDKDGLTYLWSKINMQDYPNNETLIAILNAIDNTKADKTDLNDYLTKEEYVASESGGTIDLSKYLTENKANTLYAPHNILEQVYPVGSIYLSTVATDPSVLFGFGSWERIQDTFLLAAGSQFPAGSTGGEVEHTLTELEMPAHDHEFDRHQLWRNEQVPPSTTTMGDGYGANNKTLPIYTDSTIATGAGEAHNNMPPYLSVYVWKRVG